MVDGLYKACRVVNDKNLLLDYEIKLQNELEAMNSVLSRACDHVEMLLKGVSLTEVMMSANVRKNGQVHDQG